MFSCVFYIVFLDLHGRFCILFFQVAKVFTVPLADIFNPSMVHEEVLTRGGMELTLPYYTCGTERIWGLTAFVLSEVLKKVIQPALDQTVPPIPAINSKL